MDTFPFFYLPYHLQCQILQEYVPFADKVSVLAHLEGFSQILHSNRFCWRNKNVWKLLSTLRTLTPGFYVKWKQSLPDHGYQVSMSQENKISFTLCMLIPPLGYRYDCYLIHHHESFLSDGNYDLCRFCHRIHPSNFQWHKIKTEKKTIGQVREFISIFLENYVLATPVKAYLDDFDFLVNLNDRQILWTNRNVLSIGWNHTFSMKDSFWKKPWLKGKINPSDNRVEIYYGGKRRWIRPRSLESMVMDPVTRKVDRSKRVTKHSFIIGETIEQTVQMYNKPAFDHYKNVLKINFPYNDPYFFLDRNVPLKKEKKKDLDPLDILRTSWMFKNA